MPEQQDATQEETVEAATSEDVESKGDKGAKKKPAAPAAKKTKGLGKDELISAIKEMTVLELAELVKALEQEFGISAAAPLAIAATAGTASEAAAAPEEEQTEFNIILQSFGENKISVIKAVREVTALGLKEAKELVEGAPAPVKEGVNKDEAAAIKQKLEAAGAKVEVK